MRVLWISRHKPLPAQISYLKQKLGDFELIQYSQPIPTAQHAVDLIKQHNADYVVPVLPMTFIYHLVQEAKHEKFTILRAEMQTLHNCLKYPCPDYNSNTDTIMQSKDLTSGETIYRHFRFEKFVILKDIKIVTEDW